MTEPVQGELVNDDEVGHDPSEVDDEQSWSPRPMDSSIRPDQIARTSSSVLQVKRGVKGRFERYTDASGNAHAGENKKHKSSNKDKSWQLVEPAPGGPHIPDVIPSFGGHIAYGLFSDPSTDRGVLRLHGTARICEDLKQSWTLSEAAQAMIVRSGLGHLMDCMLQQLDFPLLCAFVERWQPDTNTFHMPFGEMTILLHDVAHILCIPIEGRSCSPPSGSDFVQLLAEVIGMQADTLTKPWMERKSPMLKGGGLIYAAFKTYCAEGKRPARCQAQAYLLSLLGSTLFVDKSGDRVNATLLPLLEDEVHMYAWGAGALAYLYRQLGVASRTDCRQLAGCLTLLQAWIYEYFPTLRPTRWMARDVGEDEPRALLWKVRGPRSHKEDVAALRRYRQVLDDLRPQGVEWLPYGVDPAGRHPVTLYSGLIRFMDVIEPYTPQRCLRQFGYQQVIPPRPLEPEEVCRSAFCRQYLVRYPGKLTDTLWADQQSHHCFLDRISVHADPMWAVADGYMEWYRDHSHPLIINQDDAQEPRARDRVHEGHEIAYAVTRIMMSLVRKSDEEVLATIKEQVNPLLQEFGVIEGVTLLDYPLGSGSWSGGRGGGRGSSRPTPKAPRSARREIRSKV